MTTNKNQNYRDYIDLLKDKTFIQWRIAPSEEVTKYWESIVETNPGLKRETIKADNHLKRHFSDANKFTEKDRTELLDHITQSITKKEKKHPTVLNLLPYISAACVILFIAGALLFRHTHKEQQTPPNTFLVEGNTQAPKDIQLITGGSITTFEQDIEIKVNNGVALIDEGSPNEKKIEIKNNNALNKLIVPYGKRSKIQLPDGSIAWLNSGSTLEFPSKFAKGSRNIKLQGELYIEVAPDKKNPLYVHTPQFSVEAVGTAFNVSTYPLTKSATVLVEGQINVHSKNNVKEIKPNEIAFIDELGNISTKQIDTESYTSWRNGYLLFEDTPITIVLTQIGRYYNLKFKHSEHTSLQNITCTGKLYLSENLDHIMRSLSLLTNTNYTRKDNTITITNY